MLKEVIPVFVHPSLRIRQACFGSGFGRARLCLYFGRARALRPHFLGWQHWQKVPSHEPIYNNSNWTVLSRSVSGANPYKPKGVRNMSFHRPTGQAEPVIDED